MMLSLFGKRKIKPEKAANILVNYIIEVTEKGYNSVETLVNTSNFFETKPEICPDGHKHFLIVACVGNLSFLPRFFDVDTEEAIKQDCFKKLALAFDTDSNTIKELYSDYKSTMVKLNHPSKNMLYAMSKGLFTKLDLNQYQEEFFRSQNVANPMFIKKLDDIMAQTIFNWDDFLQQYKVG